MADTTIQGLAVELTEIAPDDLFVVDDASGPTTDKTKFSTIKSHILPFYDVRDFGVTGDGATDDQPALDTLVNTTMQPDGGTLFFPGLATVGVYKLSSSLTIPANVTVELMDRASFLLGGSTVTLTINGPLRASAHLLFQNALGVQVTPNQGKVVLGNGAPVARPEWWGAGDGDYAAFTGSMTAGSPVVTAAAGTFAAGDVGKTVWVPLAGASFIDNLVTYWYSIVSKIQSVNGDGSQATLADNCVTSAPSVKCNFCWDHTAHLQSAIEAVKTVMGTILFTRGTVHCAQQLHPYEGLTFDFAGATLKKPANNSPKSTSRLIHMNHSGYNLWSGDADSALVTLKNGTLDGSLSDYQTYANYESEQHQLVFNGAGTAKAGRMRMHLDRMTLQNTPSDGIQAYSNTDTLITNSWGYNCYRGCFTASGGWSKAKITNCTFARGTESLQVLNMEAQSSGYGGSTKFDLQIDTVTCDGVIEISCQAGSVIQCSKLVQTYPGFAHSFVSATARFTDCSFQSKDQAGVGDYGLITWPGDCTFQNCDFTLFETTTPDADRTYEHIRVNWGTSGAKTNQTIRFIGCRFLLDASVETTDTINGININQAIAVGSNNRTIVRNCEFAAGIDRGIVNNNSGDLDVENNVFYSTYGTHLTLTNNAYYYTANFSGNKYRTGCTNAVYINGGVGLTTHAINFFDEVVDEAYPPTSSSLGNFTSPAKWGRRVVYVASAPGATTKAWVGDIARLKVPVAGAAYEWVCTTAGIGSGAVWKVLSTLAA